MDAGGTCAEEGKLSFPNYGATSAREGFEVEGFGTRRSFVKRSNRAFVVVGWVNWGRS